MKKSLSIIIEFTRLLCYFQKIENLIKKNNQVKLNENKSGTLVNLSLIPTETIYEIKQYLSYVMDQENTLSKIECATEEYKQFISHEKDNKDNFGIIITPN